MREKEIIASWPPAQEDRTYQDSNGSIIPSDKIGAELPAYAYVEKMIKENSKEKLQDLLESTILFTDLPLPFFETLLKIQLSNSAINFPAIKENKNVTVGSCMQTNDAFKKANGLLNPARWQELGWVSREAYEQFLNTSMLVAFSHCTHYCVVDRIIVPDEQKNKEFGGEPFYFRVRTPKEIQDNPQKNHIYTVKGFEFRGFRETSKDTLGQALAKVKEDAMLAMQHMLLVAEITGSTDIALIPFGLGVFLPGNIKDHVKPKIMEGLIEGLKTYQGPPVTINCCAPKDFYVQLLSSQNPRICFEYKPGQDAYTLANHIDDQGKTGAVEAVSAIGFPDHKARAKKCLLINAGDDDWTVLKPHMKPGQFSAGHNLYMSTADEYYGLITDFRLHSISLLAKLFPDMVAAGKIQKLPALPVKPTSEIKSGLKEVELYRIPTSDKSNYSLMIQIEKNQASLSAWKEVEAFKKALKKAYPNQNNLVEYIEDDEERMTIVIHPSVNRSFGTYIAANREDAVNFSGHEDLLKQYAKVISHTSPSFKSRVTCLINYEKCAFYHQGVEEKSLAKQKSKDTGHKEGMSLFRIFQADKPKPQQQEIQVESQIELFKEALKVKFPQVSLSIKSTLGLPGSNASIPKGAGNVIEMDLTPADYDLFIYISEMIFNEDIDSKHFKLSLQEDKIYFAIGDDDFNDLLKHQGILSNVNKTF